MSRATASQMKAGNGRPWGGRFVGRNAMPDPVLTGPRLLAGTRGPADSLLFAGNPPWRRLDCAPTAGNHPENREPNPTFAPPRADL